VLTESESELSDGRTLHVYDTGAPDDTVGPVIFWHHGTPNIGSPPKPLFAAGPAALIDDDLAYVSPWGFDPARVTAPTLFFHGEQDRMVPSSHSQWLAAVCPDAELRLYADDGYISVLRHGESALNWLAAHAHQ
jgi:fermentation-respiration switch protein FrsA (DUF1100 family)